MGEGRVDVLAERRLLGLVPVWRERLPDVVRARSIQRTGGPRRGDQVRVGQQLKLTLRDGREWESMSTATHEDQAQINHLTMIVDVYRALELLVTHPRIDPARISLMGFSRGGTVALWSSLTRFQHLHGPPGVRFAQHVAFHPGCYFQCVDDEAVGAGPIRIFYGTADDYTPIEPCRAYVERLRRAGKDAQITEYPGTHHGFDRARAAPRFRLAGAQTARTRTGAPVARGGAALT